MKKRLLMQGALCAMLMGIAAGEAQAAQTLRVQVDQKGDFLLIGNTLGHECPPARRRRSWERWALVETMD